MENEVKLPAAKSLQQVIGSLLFGSDHPLTAEEIRACLKKTAEDDESADETVKLFAALPLREVKEALGNVKKELERLDLGFELVESPDGWKFRTQAEGGRWLRKLLKMDRPARLSHPALETLAIIAYRQPISKSEIEGIRGVDAGHILKALMELHLVRIVGRSELPGRPFLYGTTPTFLDHFGLSTIKELDSIDPTLLRPESEKDKHKKKAKKSPEEEIVIADDAAAQAPAAVTAKVEAAPEVELPLSEEDAPAEESPADSGEAEEDPGSGDELDEEDEFDEEDEEDEFDEEDDEDEFDEEDEEDDEDDEDSEAESEEV